MTAWDEDSLQILNLIGRVSDATAVGESLNIGPADQGGMSFGVEHSTPSKNFDGVPESSVEESKLYLRIDSRLVSFHDHDIVCVHEVLFGCGLLKSFIFFRWSG